MQDNSLIFSVDADGTTYADETFERFETRLNSSVYHGANHVMDARNLMALFRTMPKENGNFKGFARSSYKVTQDVVVVGKDGLAQLTVPAIVKTEYVLPVGITEADRLAITRRSAAIGGNRAVIDPLTSGLVI